MQIFSTKRCSSDPFFKGRTFFLRGTNSHRIQHRYITHKYKNKHVYKYYSCARSYSDLFLGKTFYFSRNFCTTNQGGNTSIKQNFWRLVVFWRLSKQTDIFNWTMQSQMNSMPCWIELHLSIFNWTEFSQSRSVGQWPTAESPDQYLC